jgi:integrase
MTPRKASLRVAHGAKCANATKTALETAGKGSGCMCQPSYYVSYQDASGRTHKTPRVKDRREAEKVLTERQGNLDRGVSGIAVQKNMTFPEWVDVFLSEVLPGRGGKGSTERAYRDILTGSPEGESEANAVSAIGHMRVRDIGPSELRRYVASVSHTSPANQLKHLRHLSACLSAAVEEGLMDKNPVPAFRKSLKLKAGKGTPPYTDGELERLLGALATAEPVYRTIVHLAAETGARIGELIALDWPNVNMLASPRIEIRHTYDSTDKKVTTPKDGDARTVHLTPAAEAVVVAWIQRVGVKESGPVFTAPRSGDRLNADYLRKLINAALTEAGVPKDDARTGRPRKPSHSLRATYARRMLESGRHPQWVEAQLGHSDLELTMHVYGEWSEERIVAEANRA